MDAIQWINDLPVGTGILLIPRGWEAAACDYSSRRRFFF